MYVKQLRFSFICEVRWVLYLIWIDQNVHSLWVNLLLILLDLCFMKLSLNGRPPLWSIGHSSWLQIQIGFDSLHYQIFWEVVGLERGPLSLVSTIEELLERKSSGSGLEIRDYDSRDLLTLTTWYTLSTKVSTIFTDKRWSLGRYSSLAESGHGVFSLNGM
jgi:hypothetical protein